MPLKPSVKTVKKWLKSLLISRQTQFVSTEKRTQELNVLTQYPIQWVEK